MQTIESLCRMVWSFLPKNTSKKNSEDQERLKPKTHGYGVKTLSNWAT